jgi:hypothetical protein
VVAGSSGPRSRSEATSPVGGGGVGFRESRSSACRV